MRRNPAKQIAAWNTFERELTRLAHDDARGALPGLAKLARAYPDSPVFQGTYARALKDTGTAVKAVEVYQRLVARWPKDAACITTSPLPPLRRACRRRPRAPSRHPWRCNRRMPRPQMASAWC